MPEDKKTSKKKETPKKETPQKEEAKKIVPKKEEPKKEAPKAEAPKAEAPKKEPTPKAETKAPSKPKTASEVRRDFAVAAQGKDNATKAKLKAQFRKDLAAAKAR